MIRNKSKIISAVAVVITFILCFIFFYFIRPLGIYDSDDWSYVSYVRHVYPSLAEWNPTRVLPETWLPLLGAISSYIVYPILGDYIGSITLTLAIFSAAFISVFGYVVMKLFKEVFADDLVGVITYWALFLLSGMLIFGAGNSQHLFWAENVTCFFYYIVPGILNAITVLVIMIRRHKGTFKVDALIVFLVYFCINSNMYSSILLVAFLSAESLWDVSCKWLKRKNEKVTLKSIIIDNLFTIVVDVIWLISLAMELNGGRAKMLGASGGFNLKSTLINFYYCIMGMNRGWVVINFLLIVFLLVYSIKKKDQTKMVVSLIVSLAVTTLYLILLCAKVDPVYIGESKSLFPVLFIIDLLSIMAVSKLVKSWPVVKIAMPCVLFSLAIMFSYYAPGYRHYNVNQLSYEQSKRVNDDILEQIFEAKERGENEITVYVPKHASDMWPISISYGGNNVAQALFRHGLTESWMKITFVQSEEKNKELCVE